MPTNRQGRTILFYQSVNYTRVYSILDVSRCRGEAIVEAVAICHAALST